MNPATRGPALLVRGSFLLFLLAGMEPASSQEKVPSGPPLPRQYVCYRATTDVKVDGRLDDPAWASARWTEEFVDIEGDRRPKPRFRTRAKMLWDDRYFYVAAAMEEPHVWATLTRHDSVIFHDNDFEIFIDPDGDNHEYYELEINALNTEWDLRLVKPYKDGGPALNSWEIPGLVTAVHVDGTLNDPGDVDRGWSVELAIPWTALAEFARRPAPPEDGDQWRVNFSRVEWRHEVKEHEYVKVAGEREDNWVWSPQGAINMHLPEHWGYVQFSTAKPGAALFRPDPTAEARSLLHAVYYAQTRYRRENGRWARGLSELELDETIRARVSESLKLDGTATGYEATAVISLPGGSARRLTIRQDARIRSEDVTAP